MPGYGGYTWSSNEVPEDGSADVNILNLLGLGAAAAGAYKLAHHQTAGTPFTSIDYMAMRAERAQDRTLLGLMGVIPSAAITPFTSNEYRANLNTGNAQYYGFFDPAGQSELPAGATYTWSKEFLGEDSTYDWIKHTTQKTDAELQELGVSRGGHGDAERIVYRRPDANSALGHLEVQYAEGTGKESKLLASDIMLMSTRSRDSMVTPVGGINRSVSAVFSAADIYTKGKPGTTPADFERTVFSGLVPDPNNPGKFTRETASFIPVRGYKSSVIGGYQMGRTFLAGGLDRFNKLLGDVAYQIGGQDLQESAAKVLGTAGAGYTPGPASSQLLRVGGKATMAYGAYLGVQELDWYRRRFGEVGHVFASAAVSSGVAAATYKLGMNPRHQMMAGVGSFFGQMVMPGFRQGTVEGVATTFANMNVVRAMPLNPMNHWRRTLEGIAPGISDFETGVFLGIGAAGIASGVGSSILHSITGERPASIAQLAARHFGGSDFTEENVKQAQKTIRSYYEDILESEGVQKSNVPFSSLLNDDARETFKDNERWSKAINMHKEAQQHNPMSKALVSRLEEISAKYESQDGILARLSQSLEGKLAEFQYSLGGADLQSYKAKGLDDALISGPQIAKNLNFTGLGPLNVGKGGRAFTAGFFALAAQQLAFGGLLGSMETSDELRKIYSGEKLVEVRKGRYWEGGGTAFEGERTSYFRPHQYALMMSRAEQASVFGEGEDSYSPLYKAFLSNFTYEVERMNYYDRPYPITGAAFANVPVVGGLLASTIGRVIKPPKIMHHDEFIREGEEGQLEFASVYKGSRREPAYSLGALGEGIPTSPFSSREQLAFLDYQTKELMGMPGFMASTAQEFFLGSSDLGSGAPILASANEMSSVKKSFWEMESGGMLGANEFLRRIIPNTPAEKRTVNPLYNTMPSWLPDKFKFGDPYTSIQAGYARLPGAGYAALHKELKGVSPEAYPLIYQYAILSDVAPLSSEYFSAKERIYQQREAGAYNAKQQAFIDELDRMHSKRVEGFNFDDMKDNAYDAPGFSSIRSAYKGLGQAMRSTVQPVEYLSPFRPISKFVNQRGPIEEYEFQRMYGTPQAFWDQIPRDFLRPAFYSTLHNLGYDGKPLWRHEADTNQEYFDKLEFIKHMRIARAYREQGNITAAQAAERAAGQTRHGVNPQGSPLAIYYSLPAEERKFFNAFAFAEDSEKARILEMIPRDQQHLYKAIWSRVAAGEFSMADSTVAGGFQDLGYLESRMDEAETYMEDQPMPDPDWIGWNADVSMDDIRVRYINELGKDLHDFGMWESDLKRSMRQPFLEGSTDYLYNQGKINMVSGSDNALRGNNAVSAMRYEGIRSSFNVTYNDDRQMEISSMVSGILNGY